MIADGSFDRSLFVGRMTDDTKLSRGQMAFRARKAFLTCFSDNPADALQAAYFLVVNSRAAMDGFDPNGLADDLDPVKARQFKVALEAVLRKAKADFRVSLKAKKIETYRDVDSPSEVEVALGIKRTLSFSIGNQAVVLQGPKEIDYSRLLQIGCDLATKRVSQTISYDRDGEPIVSALATFIVDEEHLSTDLPISVVSPAFYLRRLIPLERQSVAR